MANPSQLFLLADHIKLSLLERQRAVSLNLEPNAQDGNISRSLETMREGIEALEQEVGRLQDEADSYVPYYPTLWSGLIRSRSAEVIQDQATQLRTQYTDLDNQFTSTPTQQKPSSTIAQPNDPALSPDFAHAVTTAPAATSPSAPRSASKSVRFRDDPASAPDPAREALFPYRDEPDPATTVPNQAELSNQQIHTYHAQVLADQDDQLDRLGASIGRQRELGVRIGDELDEHVLMLDEVEGHVDRHQGRLGGARERIGKIARRANDNKSCTIIVVLVVILVLLIAVLK